MGYGIVLVPAGIGCIINGRERGKGCSADTADRLSADLGTSTTDIFVQRSRTHMRSMMLMMHSMMMMMSLLLSVMLGMMLAAPVRWISVIKD